MRRRGPVFHRGRKRPEKPALRGDVLLDDDTRRRIRTQHARKLGSAILGGLLMLFLVGMYFSPIFRVQQIEIVGATDADRQQIADMVQKQGNSMFTVTFGGSEAQIAALPQVKTVDISRHWPDTVRVTLVERQPWGTWIAGTTPYVIDQEGVVLPEGFPAPEGSLVIKALAAPPLVAGDSVDQDAVVLTNALVNELPVRMGINVSEVDWSTAKGLVVTTNAGYTVVVGDSENIEYKLAVWQQIDLELGRESMVGHVLDLRFGERPSLQ